MKIDVKIFVLVLALNALLFAKENISYPYENRVLDLVSYGKIVENVVGHQYTLDEYERDRLNTSIYILGLNNSYIGYIVEKYYEGIGAGPIYDFVIQNIYTRDIMVNDELTAIEFMKQGLDETGVTFKNDYVARLPKFKTFLKKYALELSTNIKISPITALKNFTVNVEKVYTVEDTFGSRVVKNYNIVLSGAASKQTYQEINLAKEFVRDVRAVGFIQEKDNIVFVILEARGAKVPFDIDLKFVGFKLLSK